VQENAISVSRIPEAIKKWEEGNAKVLELVENANKK
jgi:hypothetical protein